MNTRGILLRIGFCIATLATLLYSYVDRQNDVTRLRLKIPQIAKEIKNLGEENTRLQYEIDLFESPQNLMQLASHCEFAHLKHPMLKEIITLDEGLALQSPSGEMGEIPSAKPRLPLAVGSR